jgi:Mn2+/Fe2+ NRAMP family transporter
MKKIFEIALGILTAIGGFVDIGDLVANAETGSRFRMALAWAVVLGVIGIILYAEMAGRVAALSKRPVFDLIRERLGARMALANLLASFFINFLTVAAEVAGVALALQLATSVNYLLWIPLVAFLVWFVIWRVKYSFMENTFGLLGLLLIAFAVALWRFGPDWSSLLHEATHPVVPHGEGHATYFYFAIALFGAAMTPYEVFFFSSGAIEEHWGKRDLMIERANVLIGFPLGALLSLTIMALTSLVFFPRGIQVGTLSQVALPVVVILGKLGFAALLVGIFAATFGAALETGLSAGYIVAQFFGWPWGKFERPADAPAFHLVCLLSILFGALLVLTQIDPIKVTEYSIVLSAAALPLTYFPILVIANDPVYVGDKTNTRFTNFVGTIYLFILLLVSIATIPLMIITKAGS